MCNYRNFSFAVPIRQDTQNHTLQTINIVGFFPNNFMKFEEHEIKMNNLTPNAKAKIGMMRSENKVLWKFTKIHYTKIKKIWNKFRFDIYIEVNEARMRSCQNNCM